MVTFRVKGSVADNGGAQGGRGPEKVNSRTKGIEELLGLGLSSHQSVPCKTVEAENHTKNDS
jgi:hypothetical protein